METDPEVMNIVRIAKQFNRTPEFMHKCADDWLNESTKRKEPEGVDSAIHQSNVLRAAANVLEKESSNG